MTEGLKKSKVAEAIKHGVDIYLSENADILGYAHVEHVSLADDLRSCVIIVIALEDQKVEKILDFLKLNHYHIYRELKKRFSSKYFPKISFEVISDEKIGI